MLTHFGGFFFTFLEDRDKSEVVHLMSFPW